MSVAITGTTRHHISMDGLCLHLFGLSCYSSPMLPLVKALRSDHRASTPQSLPKAWDENAMDCGGMFVSTRPVLCHRPTSWSCLMLFVPSLSFSHPAIGPLLILGPAILPTALHLCSHWTVSSHCRCLENASVILEKILSQPARWLGIKRCLSPGLIT